MLEPMDIVYTVLFLAAAILAFCIKPERFVAADCSRMLYEILKNAGVAIDARHKATAQTITSSRRVNPREAALPRECFVYSFLIVSQ